MRAKITQNPDGSVSYTVPDSQEGNVKSFALYADEVSTGKVLKFSYRIFKTGKTSVNHGYFFDHTGRCPIYKPDMTTLQMARAFREREMDYLRTLKNDNKD